MRIITIDNPRKFPACSSCTFEDDNPDDAALTYREYFGIEPETVYYYISPTPDKNGRPWRKVMIPMPDEWVA